MFIYSVMPQTVQYQMVRD